MRGFRGGGEVQTPSFKKSLQICPRPLLANTITCITPLPWKKLDPRMYFIYNQDYMMEIILNCPL